MVNEINKNDYLSGLPNEYPLMLASFFVTNPAALQKMKKQWAERDNEHKIRGRTEIQIKEVQNEIFGGSVCLFDPERMDLGFLAEINVPTASGLYYSKIEKALYVGSNMHIQKVQAGKIIATLNNNLFCDVHTIEEGPYGNLLISSTGVDGIILINPNNPEQIIWDWLATEFGYNITPDGRERRIDRKINYQYTYSITPNHTTHLNSAIYYNHKIYSCLFHQGKLIEINPVTKEHKILLEGMICPHHFRSKNMGYIISDSRANRAMLLDYGFNIVKSINGNFDWVQDALEFKNGQYLIGDSNNNRFVRVDENGIKINELRYEERKMFCFLQIKKLYALNIFSK